MKIVKTILYVLLGLVALWLIVAAFISGDFKYEKSIVINAPADQVWQHTNTLKAMETWSPWNDKDPNMKKEWTGQTGEPGEQQCWEGNDDVGKGCQTVQSVDSGNRRIETRMKFLTPYESEANAFVTVAPEGSGSKATWGFTSRIPYPFTVTKLFMNMEEALGADYQLGLDRLKKLSEQP